MRTVLLLVGLWVVVHAGPAQVPVRQTTIIVNWTNTTADTFLVTAAPAKIVLSLGRDSTGAHLVCGYSFVTPGATPWPFAIRWAGDTLRHVVATWRPLCIP